MPHLTEECLLNLRKKIDILEVLNGHLSMQRTGGTYKALCPFHTEKTPSFVVNVGQNHYHCYGCGAHGDAISFLMNYLGMRFTEAVEQLATRFHVPLQYEEGKVQKNTAALTAHKICLKETKELYQVHLLQSAEGRRAQEYLKKRGLGLDFIKAFCLGYCPSNEEVTLEFFRKKKWKKEDLIQAGLAKEYKGRLRPFFTNRISIPINDVAGNVIGFSARKIDEDVFGGKYINTPETPLFKKSHILFGLSYARRRIVKEKRVILAEGQLDVLRLIHEGLDLAVAAQGTALGKDHVRELLRLGIESAYIAFDGDKAGQEAAIKVGQLLQIEGVEVLVVPFLEKDDPDSYIQKHGRDALIKLLKQSQPFIPFVVNTLKKIVGTHTPAKKNKVVCQITKMLQEWKHVTMVHEAKKHFAFLLDVPVDAFDIQSSPQAMATESKVKIDNHRLEYEFLRYFLYLAQNYPEKAQSILPYLHAQDLVEKECCDVYNECVRQVSEGGRCDIILMASTLRTEKEQSLFQYMTSKSLDLRIVKKGVLETAQKILDRNWMVKRDKILQQMQARSEKKEMETLAKEYDKLNRERMELNYQTITL